LRTSCFERAVPIPRHLDVHRPGRVGQHRLAADPVPRIAAVAAGRVVLVVAQVLAHLLVQGGLDHRLGQGLQQPVRAGQRHAALASQLHQLPRGVQLGRRRRPLLVFLRWWLHDHQCLGHHDPLRPVHAEPIRPVTPFARQSPASRNAT